MKVAVRRSSPARQWKSDSLSLRRRLMQLRLRPDSNLRQGNGRLVNHLNSALAKIRKWSPKINLANRQAKARLESIKVWDVSA
jgi:hypothetical protein